MISYEGIDEAVLICALYHGTRAVGLGALHDSRGLTVEQVRNDLGSLDGLARTERFDYYRGRPFKFYLDLKAKKFDARLYDRDAGAGTAARIVRDLGGTP